MYCEQVEKKVVEALKSGATSEELDKVLKLFLDSRENYHGAHGTWVHSLSHFTEELWKLGRLDWIKRFNEIAFRGASELRDANCSDRLVGDFAAYAAFNLNPADFHLAPDNLRWMQWSRYSAYDKARIEHGRFDSAEDLQRFKLLWELRNAQLSVVGYDGRVDVVKLDGNLGELQKLGVDMSEFSGLKQALVEPWLRKLEVQLTEIPNKDWKEDFKEWKRQETQKMINEAKAALGA